MKGRNSWWHTEILKIKIFSRKFLTGSQNYKFSKSVSDRVIFRVKIRVKIRGLLNFWSSFGHFCNFSGWKLENFSIFCPGFAIFATFQGENWKNFQFLHLTGPIFTIDSFLTGSTFQTSAARPRQPSRSVPPQACTLLSCRQRTITMR